jgi:hypothetical protein
MQLRSDTCDHEKSRKPLRIRGFRSAGEQGFEPQLTDPESVVLPLHYSPIPSIRYVRQGRSVKGGPERAMAVTVVDRSAVSGLRGFRTGGLGVVRHEPRRCWLTVCEPGEDRLGVCWRSQARHTLAAGGFMSFLVVESGPERGQAYMNLPRAPCSSAGIPTAISCSNSARSAAITPKSFASRKKYFVEDLKSRNKTFLNNEPVEGHRGLLHPGDQIRVCEVSFRLPRENPPTTSAEGRQTRRRCLLARSG